jgi:hypothetical protein
LLHQVNLPFFFTLFYSVLLVNDGGLKKGQITRKKGKFGGVFVCLRAANPLSARVACIPTRFDLCRIVLAGNLSDSGG